MIGTFAAVQPEVEACPLSLRSGGERSLGRFLLLEGDSGFVCRTGMGRAAEEAARTAVAELRPQAVLSVGTAGGLSDELDTGDIVLCSHLHAWTGGTEGPEPVTADERLLAAAEETARETGASVRSGGSVTVDEVAWGPEEKRRLREWMSHDIVEMESYWVGKAAREAGVPFLAVRVVSDGHGESVPHVPGMVTAEGTVDQSAILAYVQENPEAAPKLAQLYERGLRARDSLRAFLDAFIPAIAQVPR